METKNKQNGAIIAIITMMFLFAMISFVTNLAAPFGLIWGNEYNWAGMMGNLMNFLAYLFMGIPAGKMLINYGYKKTASSGTTASDSICLVGQTSDDEIVIGIK
jgi:FHS family L-fucose permease-like MFS transporter